MTSPRPLFRIWALLSLAGLVLNGVGTAHGMVDCPHHAAMGASHGHGDVAAEVHHGHHDDHDHHGPHAPVEVADGSHEEHEDGHPCDCATFCSAGSSAAPSPSSPDHLAEAPALAPLVAPLHTGALLPGVPEHFLPPANGPPGRH